MTSVSSSVPPLDRLLDGLASLNGLKASRRGQAGTRYDVDVTVTVMSYNNAPYLAQTIESVLSQEGVSLELLVFDDRSSDDSVEVLNGYVGDPRFSFQVNSVNLGMAGNYNRCVQAGNGRYLVVLGSDDVLYPGHLASLVAAMNACPGAALGYAQCNWIDENGRFIRYADHPGHRRQSYSGGRDEVADLLTFDSYITPSAAILRRSALPHVALPEGGIHRHDLLAGDWELWIRLARQFPDFVFLRQASVGYRIHSGQISNTFYGSERPLREHTEILEMNLADAPTRRRMIVHGEAIWALYQQRISAYPATTTAPYQRRIDAIHTALMAKGELSMVPSQFLFSIIMTTYNRRELLRFALDSVKAQTLQDFEVILVNDHGEGVESLLESYPYCITYLRQGRNAGPAAARNAAHRLARGQYLVYLDDDDVFLPAHLQVLADALQKHPGEVVYSDALFIAERVENGVRHVINQEQRYPHGDYSRERLLVDNYIPVNTFAWPRSAALEVGGFDETLSGLEDWDFLMRLAARLPFHHVQQETVQVRMRADESSVERRSQQALKDYPALYKEMYRRHGDMGSAAVKAGRVDLLQRLGADVEVTRQPPSMQAWLQRRALTPPQKALVDERLEGQGGAPHFGILIVDLQGDHATLARTLASLDSARDNYAKLQAVVLSSAENVANFPSCQVVAVRPDDWLAALNELLAASAFDWCLLLRAGEELTPSGLMMAGLELLTAPDCRAIYCDEMFRQEGQLAAALRPAFNLDYLLSFPAGMARHWLFRRDVIVAAGGFDPAFEQAAELELILRLINQGGLDGLGHVAEPLLITEAPALADNDAEQRAIAQHLQQRGYSDAAVTSVKPGRYRIDYGHAQSPLVSFLILPGECLEHLQRCVESILENTRYPNYELLLIQSPLQTDEVGAWLGALASLGEARIRVLPAGQEVLAPQTLLNQAAEQAHGDYLLLLSADTAAISEDWLDELVNHAQRPEVACVGAKLLSADGKIARASLILGLEGPVGRPYVGEPLDAPGYMQRLQVVQNSSAVGHECLLVAKAVFLQLGGLREEGMPWRYAGVDLCLKARQAGYLTVWTPFSQLMLDPVDISRGTTAEHDALYAEWLPVLARDPAYNPNFSLSQPGGFKLADTALSWRPLSSWKPVPTVLAHPSDNYGSGYYRVIQPFSALQQAGLIDGGLSPGLMHVTDLERYDPDVIILQKQIGDDRFDAMRRMQAFSRAFKVYELDDYLPNLPVKSVHRAQMPKDILKSMRRGLGYVDRFVVSTQALADACSGLHDDIRVIENCLPPAWWKGLAAGRNSSQKPRVGWAGGIGHTGDLEMIADVVLALADEVDWVFMGMCPDRLRPAVKEVHEGVDIGVYPRALAALNLDLAVAPLEENLFNECKSNLRLLEYGACGFAVVCSDLRSYQGNLPVTRVKNRYRDWMEAIRMHVGDLDATARAGEALHQQVMRDWMLEGDNLVAWRRAWLPD
ncbi:glycosyltransferase [Pseudomonas sp. CNPSo 3701]|uniref:glycosyltransferase n=1 Tax=Pseudomonas sp. CNPSo 3701 TaxID=3027943 RepID=UPI0023645E17|nr:glycosyltransferase [Pseudomonas sp. CNPSo 3701]MDD1507788.1 glycosyltransferase [Pseudomonas sp. CNPSo 3701]